MPVEGSLVDALHEIQGRCGYLPKPELEALAGRQPEYPLHRLHEVASFFPHFRLEPPPGLEVKVCRDMACHLAGAVRVRDDLEAFAEEAGPGRVVVRRGVVPRPLRRRAGGRRRRTHAIRDSPPPGSGRRWPKPWRIRRAGRNRVPWALARGRGR